MSVVGSSFVPEHYFLYFDSDVTKDEDTTMRYDGWGRNPLQRSPGCAQCGPEHLLTANDAAP